jgi:serine/threonine protein kinase
MNGNGTPAPVAADATKGENASSPSMVKKMFRGVKRITARHAKSDVERSYKFGAELGTGNFAVVRLAEHRTTRKKYACKIINKALCSGKEDMIETEVNVLKRIRHKYAVVVISRSLG